MAHTIRKTMLVVLALGAIAFGASALAGAASNKSSTSPPQGSAAQAPDPPGGPPDGRNGGLHVGANGQREVLLTDGTATKVRDAALAKVSGTVERVETDVDFGSPYEAHIRKADGSEVSVLVNKDFQVTAVKAMGPH